MSFHSFRNPKKSRLLKFFFQLEINETPRLSKEIFAEINCFEYGLENKQISQLSNELAKRLIEIEKDKKEICKEFFKDYYKLFSSAQLKQEIEEIQFQVKPLWNRFISILIESDRQDLIIDKNEFICGVINKNKKIINLIEEVNKFPKSNYRLRNYKTLFWFKPITKIIENLAVETKGFNSVADFSD